MKLPEDVIEILLEPQFREKVDSLKIMTSRAIENGQEVFWIISIETVVEIIKLELVATVPCKKLAMKFYSQTFWLF